MVHEESAHLCEAAEHSAAMQMCEASRPMTICDSLSHSPQCMVPCRYERRYIVRWLSQGNLLCPATGLALQRPVALTSNLAMRRSIEDWAQRNAGWMLVCAARGPMVAPHQAGGRAGTVAGIVPAWHQAEAPGGVPCRSGFWSPSQRDLCRCCSGVWQTTRHC